ncbi:enoyl-CoA hydratase/isomerase family protein [Leeia sp. TBRC 13508]|uniref:3-hydroxyisobutyryl-CoA hydrolase n=1 Tax=Leeia speluncae TaxID=2884804 RepID=A0ABS8D7Z1_9NEIS|nr:enoyl-CoA hydratase/isomerase family protein [Leeia speluncae]MCB6184313.1 enoyl-CoA hydratase/isomerase family protein [Leeia speluncae]
MTVQVAEKRTTNGYVVGFLTLDRPEVLHALSFEMMQTISSQILQWKDRKDVVAVVLASSTERAFCAGGDIREMYQQVKSLPKEEAKAFAENYFAVEYGLEYELHRYPKPIIAWGGGIVMGGGWGLFAGASHRIITETSRMAMPEVHIGLYPDAGGSWFLSRLPGNLGKFLALTGTSIFPRDIMRLGIADYCLANRQKDVCLTDLLSLPWSDNSTSNHDLITLLMNDLAAVESFELPDANIFPVRQAISRALHAKQVTKAVSALLTLKGMTPWLDAALTQLSKGSPLSQHLAFAMQEKAKHASLADSFRLEWWVSVNCCLYPDYSEGVRALLIDRDGEPKWQASSLAGVSTEVLDQFLNPDFSNINHPLMNLN